MSATETLDTPTGAILFNTSRDGVFAIHARDVLSPDMWPALEALKARAEKHAASEKVAAAEQQFKEGVKRDSIKQFVVKWIDDQAYDADDPALQIGESATLRNLADQICGKQMRLISADLWHLISDCSGTAREWSQNWHRDPESPDVVKFTLYLSDVDLTAGPFEYIKGSQNGRYATLCEPGKYGDQAAIETVVPVEDRLAFIGGPESLIIARTNGIHRGGYTRGKSRQSITWTFVPRDSNCQQLYSVREAVELRAGPTITVTANGSANDHQVAHERAVKKIAIVGKAPSSRMAAPFGDVSWEIWGLTDLYTLIPRFDRWFELHEIDPRKKGWGPYWDWLKKDHGKPLYIREPHPELPHGIIYPKREIVTRFGSYFTNSVSWMIALAIQENATHISLYGVDMAQHADGVRSEYAHQRPSCEYFLGIAAGLGIKTYVHDHSDLLKTRRLYAFDSEASEMRRKWAARHKELADQLKDVNGKIESVSNEHRTAIDQLVKRQHVLMGALDDMQWTRQWCEE